MGSVRWILEEGWVPRRALRRGSQNEVSYIMDAEARLSESTSPFVSASSL